MQIPDIKHLLATAIEASILAGHEILKVYDTDFEVEVKDDNSPLTRADKNAHKVITEALIPAGLPLLSEEGKSIPFTQRKDWDLFWMVDPMDGTKEFVKRNGEFTVNIALIHHGRAIMGVIYVPVTATLYFGSEGSGAYRLEGINSFESMDSIYSKAVQLPGKREDGKFTVICSRSHLSGETEDYIRQMEALHGEIVLTSKGSSLKLCLIAEGRADSYPRYAPTMEWDTAAGQAIVEASGGEVLKTKTTEPLRYNKEDLLNPWFVASR